MSNTPSKDVTRLLQAWAAGDEQALTDLVPLVYGEIRGVAHAALRRERPGRPIQTTELVNEAYGPARAADPYAMAEPFAFLRDRGAGHASNPGR